MQDHRKLEIWQRAMDYAVAVHRFTAGLPDIERFSLGDQLRRAATSVPLNIAEGCGTASQKEFGVFLGYAYRSLKEVSTGLELCERLYPACGSGQVRRLLDEGDQLTRMTWCLMRQSAAPR